MFYRSRIECLFSWRHGVWCDLQFFTCFCQIRAMTCWICWKLTMSRRCRSELNLGVQPAGFTVVKSYRPTDDYKDYLRVSVTTLSLCCSDVCVFYMQLLRQDVPRVLMLRCIINELLLNEDCVIGSAACVGGVWYHRHFHYLLLQQNPERCDVVVAKQALKWKRKHCALAIVRQSQKFSPAADLLPGGAGRPKFNQLEMVTTFT